MRIIDRSNQYGICSILEDANLVLGDSQKEKSVIPIEHQNKEIVPAANSSNEVTGTAVPRKKAILEEVAQARKQWADTPLDMAVNRNEDSMLCAMKRIGIDHIRKNMPCQDSYKVHVGSGYKVVSVADGHSNKRHDLSEHGSALACESVCEVISDAVALMDGDKVLQYFKDIKFKYDIIIKWKEKVLAHYRAEIDADAEASQKIFVRYGTTLLFAVSFKDKLIMGKLGDGGILLSADDNYFQLLFKETKTGPETFSMCMNDAYMFMNVRVLNKCDFNRVMLMTDGIFDLFASQEYIEKNMTEFVKMLGPDDIVMLSAFSGKFNEFAEYSTDDIAVGLMCIDQPVSEIVPQVLRGNNEYVVDDVEYRERSIKLHCSSDNKKYIAILSKYIRPETPLYNKAARFIAEPCEVFVINEYTCCIYSHEPGKTVEDIFGSNIINGNRRMPDKTLIDIIDLLLTNYSELQLMKLGDRELFYEMTGLMSENNDPVILAYSAKEQMLGRVSLVMHLLIDIIIGWHCDTDNIICRNGGIEITFADKDSVIQRNIELIHSQYIKEILYGNENKVCSVLQRVLPVSCKQCGGTILTYRSINMCPHCRQSIVAKAQYHNDELGIYGYLCTNTVLNGFNIGINNKNRIIETMYQPSTGSLGIKNVSDERLMINEQPVGSTPTKLNDGDVVSVDKISMTIFVNKLTGKSRG